MSASLPLEGQPIRSRAGFTLIEMLVVLTILSLLAVIVVPRVSRSPEGLTRRTTTLALERRLHAAEIQARRNGAPATVILPEIGARLRVTGGLSTQFDRLLVYPDGTTSGGTILDGDRPLTAVDWLTGELRDAS